MYSTHTNKYKRKLIYVPLNFDCAKLKKIVVPFYIELVMSSTV